MAWVLAGPRLDRSGLTWAVKPRFGEARAPVQGD